jgi:CHASE3 domain sensor protein
MGNTLRKIALEIAIASLAVLIAVNAYVVIRNLKHIQETTSRRVEAALMQADISNVLLDLDDMETGQRGYLLTGNPSYLRPYNDANGRLAAHFSSLRSRLTAKPSEQERSIEAHLESVAQAKIAEIEETIRLREKGYRRRAFVLVNSNHGQELMEEARSTLNTLSSAQRSNVARSERELNESVRRAYKESVSANCILLAVTAGTLLVFNMYSKRLERSCAHCSEQLRATSTQVERLTSTVSQNFRALVQNTQTDAKTLLDSYGGFLPRRGQEHAESIYHGTDQMNRLLDELFKESPSGKSSPVL